MGVINNTVPSFPVSPYLLSRGQREREREREGERERDLSIY